MLPTRCLMIWPKEKCFQNFEWFLVGCIHILFEVERWWWWSIWCWFAKFQNGVNLLSISKSQLASFILVNLVKVSTSGQQQKGSPWHGLGWHGKSWSRLVWEKSKPGVQSGEDVINGQSDHYLMWVEFEFLFDLNWVSLIQMGVLLIYKCFTNNGTSQSGLGWRFAKMAKCVCEWKMGFSLYLISLFLIWFFLTPKWFLLV
jgi:hypothetical protein